MIRLLFYLQSAFTIWMLIDAVQRHAGYYWWAIIFFFPPVGPWMYFFMVKIHDFDANWIQNSVGLDAKWLKKFFHQEASLEQLQYRHRINPCLENKVQLAKRLYDEREYAEASSLFTEALKMDAEDKEALYGSALCKTKLEKFPEAIESLRKLLQLEKRFRHYLAWEELASVHWLNGEKEETIRLMQELLRTSPNIKNATLLANYLLQLERRKEAVKLLENALEDFRNAPNYVKRSNQKWASQAREILKSVSTQSGAPQKS